MTAVPFTRPTIIAAVAFLAKIYQAPFNHMVLRLGLEDEIASDAAISVAKKATKQEIAQAVAESFKVDVIAVNTLTVHGKTRRIGKKIGKQSDWKKAVVTLAEGQRIERYFVEGV